MSIRPIPDCHNLVPKASFTVPQTSPKSHPLRWLQLLKVILPLALLLFLGLLTEHLVDQQFQRKQAEAEQELLVKAAAFLLKGNTGD